MKTTLLFACLALSGLSVLSTKIIRTYYYVKKAKTWAAAQSYCRQKFSDLATVENNEDYNKLLRVLKGPRKNVWIGLHDDLTRWKWSLGKADFNNDTDFSNWKSTEPVVQKAPRCCVVMAPNGLWYSSICATPHPAICYHEEGPSRYILVKNKMNWFKAQQHCKSEYTALASARNMSENRHISSLLSEKTWIGLKREHWAHWSDQSPITFTKWKRGEPNSIGNNIAACALHIRNTRTWADTDCRRNHYFICQKVQEHKMSLKLKFQSEADLNDPAVQQQILEQLHAKLEKHGFPDFKLRWIETDGQIFHKEQKRKKEEGSGG